MLAFVIDQDDERTVLVVEWIAHVSCSGLG
jgi:hypothetical protein